MHIVRSFLQININVLSLFPWDLLITTSDFTYHFYCVPLKAFSTSWDYRTTSEYAIKLIANLASNKKLRKNYSSAFRDSHKKLNHE